MSIPPKHPHRIVVSAPSCRARWLYILLVAGALLFLYLIDPKSSRCYPVCPTYRLLHVYCPVCGSTRALHALLHGDIGTSLRHNLLFLPGLVGAFFLWRKPQARWHRPLLWTAIVMMLLFGLLRNLPYYPLTLLAPH